MKRLLLYIMVLTAAALFISCTAPKNSNPVNPTGTPGENAGNNGGNNEAPSESEIILKSLTPEEKIGQLIIAGFPKDTSDDVIADYIDRYRIGGFIFFKDNFTDFESLYNLSSKLKSMNSAKSKLPLFISVDEEGGTVSRIPAGGTKFPDAQLVGKADNTSLTMKSGEVIGEELKAAGINLDFAPVLDIVTSSKNKLLLRRSYGSNPDIVSRHGIAFIKGIRSKDVIAVGKHFPGHGSTTTDSHSSLPVINIGKDTLFSRELVPFKRSISEGLDAIMVGHLSFPELEPSGAPATMSSYFLRDLLRNELGFQGLAISDDLEMGGYLNAEGSFEEHVVTSFNAGMDIFVVGHTKEIQDRVLKALTDAYNEGKITEERLNESVLRIIDTKLKYKLSDSMTYSFEEARNHFGTKEHKAVLDEINKAIKAKI
ncbi:MAG: beta-N-acetylhexosaminidase [Caulobacteraceae bacterium]